VETLKELLTEQEHKVVVSLGDSWNAYLKLPVLHSSDTSDFISAIHAAQNIILARAVLRMVGRKPIDEPVRGHTIVADHVPEWAEGGECTPI
jgi:hypothetical protein